MKNFAKILRKTQPQLKISVADRLKALEREVIVDDGFVYSQGSMPVLLVAHLDTVHKDMPTQIFYDENTETLSSPQGIGGDDRCGVYMIFQVIKKFDCSVLFCEDEEIGAKGARKFIDSDYSKDLEFNYIIEFDRRGKDDAVFYDCDNPEFEEFITQDFYKTAWGSFSDISWLAPHFRCAAVNLSCGYYNAHTLDEYIVIPQMEDSIDAACRILERTTDDDKFEYVEAKNAYKSLYGYDDYIEAWYSIIYYEGSKKRYFDTFATSEDEAVGKFCKNHPDVPYSDIVDIDCDGESSWYI